MDKKLTYEELNLKIQDLEDRIKVYENEELALLKKISELEQIGKYYYALMDNTEDAFLISDNHGKPQAFNSSYKRTIKKLLDLDMRPGIRPHTLLKDTKAKKYWDSLHQRVLAGEKFRSEYTHVIDDNLIMHFETTFCPIVEEDEVTGFTEITRDISDRKQAEERLLYDETLLRHVLDTSPAVIFVKDSDSTILLANKKMASFYNLSVEEVTGRRQSDLHVALGMCQKEVEEWLADDLEVIDNGIIKHLLETGTDSNNRLLWFETDKYPIDIGEGRRGVLVISRDITERKRTEESLRKSEQKYRNLVESTDDWVWACDLEGRQTFANETVRNILGYEIREIMGVSADTFIYPEDAKRIKKWFKRAVTEKRGWKNNIVRWKHKNGTLRFLESSGKPILDSKGDLVGFTGIDRDITERIKLEEQFLQAQKMEAIGTLAGGIAHDFNNILASILGYAELAQTELPEWSNSKDYIDQVLKAGNRAKDLVRQILTFSRKGPEIKKPLQPSVIIKEGLKFMRASLPTTIEICEDVASESDIIIANPTNIHQVLVNLCTNALHAMVEEKGVLTVKLKRVHLNEHEAALQPGVSAGSFVELLVSDTGCGMDQKTMERIFEPYFTTKDDDKGSGMGLALVHGIVQASGGYIKVESEPGKGCTFHVYFPAVEEDFVEVQKEKQQEVLPKGDERILVVDDEEPIVGAHKATLENLGYKVAAHISSEELLEEFRLSPDSFDLIISDQTMPHLSGSELAKQVLQIRPDIPIILCTGYSSTISEEKAKEIGIAKFLMKPVSQQDLAVTVREVLDKHKTQNA